MDYRVYKGKDISMYAGRSLSFVHSFIDVMLLYVHASVVRIQSEICIMTMGA